MHGITKHVSTRFAQEANAPLTYLGNIYEIIMRTINFIAS